MLKLYGSLTSPFVRHCRIALGQTQLPYELHKADYEKTAVENPTQKMPYMVTDAGLLTDSSSILKYIREVAGATFLAELDSFERFTLVNTILDTAVNLFLLEKEGITPATSDYLKRQSQRIDTAMVALERGLDPAQAMKKDCHIRAACLAEWLTFRQRLDISPYANLQALLGEAKKDAIFTQTAPS